jgi:peptidoglycan/xylan/chitin deacetylase (PgdA/CDA1 family)
VSFVLDGCYISQYTLMRPIFDAYGIKVSLAVVNSFIGSGASYMTLAQVDQMYDEGHECIHHTYDGTKQNGYANATDWTSAAAIADDIGQQWAYFRTQGWLSGVGFAVDAFSNPFAKTVTASRQALLKAAFSMAGVRCSRASVALYTTQMSLGYHGVRPYFLRGAIQVTSTDTAASIKAVIDQAEANGEWAIITLHRAVASGAGSLETTTAILEEVCAYAAQRVADGNLMVGPMGQAYNRHFAD